MRVLLAVALLLGSGCAWLEAVPPVEVCVLYKGKKFCASKVDGKWSFGADLTPEEEAEVVGLLEK